MPTTVWRLTSIQTIDAVAAVARLENPSNLSVAALYHIPMGWLMVAVFFFSFFSAAAAAARQQQ
jgi:hypothetical protein